MEGECSSVWHPKHALATPSRKPRQDRWSKFVGDEVGGEHSAGRAPGGHASHEPRLDRALGQREIVGGGPEVGRDLKRSGIGHRKGIRAADSVRCAGARVAHAPLGFARRGGAWTRTASQERAREDGAGPSSDAAMVAVGSIEMVAGAGSGIRDHAK